MKRWMSIILGAVLALMCMMDMTVPAFAAENPGVSVPVTISLSGTLPRPAEDYTIVLRADNASYPMPEGADGGVYTMTITGADTKSFPTITYDQVGIYTYTIYQTAGDSSKCTYDDSVYTLIVYVTNAGDGSGLEAAAVLYLESGGDKLPGAEFENECETERPTPEPDKPKPTPSMEPEPPKPTPSMEPGTPEPTPPAEPDTPVPTQPADPDTPKTGDESTPVLYAGLIAAGMSVAVALFLTRKAKKPEK